MTSAVAPVAPVAGVSGLNPITAGIPNFALQQMQAQRRLQLAQALTQQGLAPIDYDPKGHVSWAQGLAKALQGVVGESMFNKAAGQEANLQTQGMQATAAAFGIGQPSTPAASPSPQALGAALDPRTAALTQGAQQGSIGPTMDNAARMTALGATDTVNRPQSIDPVTPIVGADQRATRPSVVSPPPPSPLNPMGLNPYLAAMTYSADPAGYLKTLQEQLAPTDFQRVAIAAGYRPGTPEYTALMQDNLRKQNWITPPSIRPGGGIQDPRTGVITTMPTQAPAGYQNVQRSDGSWATVPTQGGTDAITASAAAGEAGKAPFGLIDTFNPSTNAPEKSYAGSVLQLPTLGGGPAPADRASAGSATPPPTFNIGGSPQERAAVFASIVRTATDPATRAAALAQLQQIQGVSSGGPSVAPPVAGNARTNGVQTGPSLGQAQGATNAQNELSANWTAQQQAHATSQTNISLLQQLRALADQAATGYEPARRQYVAQLGAYLGVPGMDAKASAGDLLGKYSSQLIAGLSARGMNTDAARDIVMAGTPNAHMQAGAIKDAVDGLVAREQMTQARTAALLPFASRRDANGYQSAATSFDGVADPRLWQMRSMTPDQLKRFTANMSPADAAQLAQKYIAAKQNGYLQ